MGNRDVWAKTSLAPTTHADRANSGRTPNKNAREFSIRARFFLSIYGSRTTSYVGPKPPVSLPFFW
jgi:hypothetical protein